MAFRSLTSAVHIHDIQDNLINLNYELIPLDIFPGSDKVLNTLTYQGQVKIRSRFKPLDISATSGQIPSPLT